jgi:hypothetical protein
MEDAEGPFKRLSYFRVRGPNNILVEVGAKRPPGGLMHQATIPTLPEMRSHRHGGR